MHLNCGGSHQNAIALGGGAVCRVGDHSPRPILTTAQRVNGKIFIMLKPRELALSLLIVKKESLKICLFAFTIALIVELV